MNTAQGAVQEKLVPVDVEGALRGKRHPARQRTVAGADRQSAAVQNDRFGRGVGHVAQIEHRVGRHGGAGVGRTQGAVGGDRECSGIYPRGTRVSVRARQQELPCPDLGQSTAVDRPGEGGVRAERADRKRGTAEQDVARAGEGAQRDGMTVHVEEGAGGHRGGGIGAEGVGGTGAQCAGYHRRRTSVGVGSRERERAGPQLGQGTAGARDGAGEGGVRAERADRKNRVAEGHCSGAVERSERVGKAVEVEETSGCHGHGRIRAECRGRTGPQGARLDGRRAGVGVEAGEHERARPELSEASPAGEVSAEGHQVGALEGERAVIDQRSGAQRAVRAARADLQGASGGDQGVAAVGVVRGQHERADAGLRQVAAAGDGVGEEKRGVAVEDEVGVVRHRAGSQRAVAGDEQRARIDRRAARVSVGGRHGQGRGACLDQSAVGQRAPERCLRRHGQHARRADQADRGGEGQRAAAGGAEGDIAAKEEAVGEVARRRGVRGERSAVERDRTGSERRVIARQHRAGIDDGAARVSVGSGQGERAGSALGECPAACQHGTDRPGSGGVSGTGQRAVGDDTVGQRDGADRLGMTSEVEGAAGEGQHPAVNQHARCAKEERAAGDERAARVSHGGGERGRAGACLAHQSGAGDRVREGERVGLVEVDRRRGVAQHDGPGRTDRA